MTSFTDFFLIQVSVLSFAYNTFELQMYASYHCLELFVHQPTKSKQC